MADNNNTGMPCKGGAERRAIILFVREHLYFKHFIKPKLFQFQLKQLFSSSIPHLHNSSQRRRRPYPTGNKVSQLHPWLDQEKDLRCAGGGGGGIISVVIPLV